MKKIIASVSASTETIPNVDGKTVSPGTADSTRADLRLSNFEIRYSVCTIVSRMEEYSELLVSFQAHGFSGPDCEFLHIDNSITQSHDSYRGNNLLISAARGEYIILCHQDVRLLEHGREQLDAVLNQLNELDPTWAACGNAGGDPSRRLVLNITDPHGSSRTTDNFPVRVRSLDENFIVLRSTANLGFSRDLSGFHLYGTDICLVADILGYSSYVVDFHLLHKSPGFRDAVFAEARERLLTKYRRAFRPRWIRTTCTLMFLSSGAVRTKIIDSSIGKIVNWFR